MDSATIIIAVISIVICSLPFVIGRNNRKKREGALLSEIKTLSFNKAIQLSKYELLSNFIIGLDEKANVLCFLRKKETGNHFMEVDLTKYIKVEVQQSNHQEGENNNTRSVIDDIVLKFHPKSSTDKITLIELYNRTETQNLSGEFQLAQEWTQFLNNRIN
jgi:type VI protein secretion system component Hcp